MTFLLWRSLEDNNRLISARNNSLGYGDQMLLRVENAETRGLPVAGIQLFGCILRGGCVTRLNLRDGNVEFCTVTYATLKDGQNGDAREFRQQGFEMNDTFG